MKVQFNTHPGLTRNQGVLTPAVVGNATVLNNNIVNYTLAKEKTEYQMLESSLVGATVISKEDKHNPGPYFSNLQS